MAEVFAGLICGYALALVATPVGAIALVRARATNEQLQRLVPPATSLVAISIILHGLAMLTLTALGILLGLLLLGIENGNPAGGIGSPNRVFTAFIIATSVIAVAPLALFSRSPRLPLLAGGLLFAGMFGWLMPYLALWGPGGG